MIIRTIAKAFVQWRTRTQAGWMILALVDAACSSLTVTADMALPRLEFISFILRPEPGFRYCRDAIRSMHGAYRVHKKASRVAPARQSTRPVGTSQGRAGGQDAGISTVSTTWITPFD